MRRPLILCLAFLALPAAAQDAARPDIGARTRSPQAMIGDFGVAQGQEDIAQALAAAAAHPLGSTENPVRVGGPAGERAYLGRLRCGNGSAPRVGARRTAGVGAFGTVVAAYSLDCGAVAPGQVDLVMDMYHEEHREDSAPPGFTITPQ